MLNLRRFLSNLSLIVVALFLVAVASANYGQPNRSIKLEQSGWFIKGKSIIKTVLNAAGGLASLNIDRNFGFGEKIKSRLAEENFKNILGAVDQEITIDSNSGEVSSVKTADTAKTEALVDENHDTAAAAIGFTKNLADDSADAEEPVVPAADAENSVSGSADNSKDSEIGTAASPSFWAAAWQKIKAEWKEADSEVNSEANSDDVSPDNRGADSNAASSTIGGLSWQKTDAGAEIIFKSKNGEESKLALPFKFLSR